MLTFRQYLSKLQEELQRIDSSKQRRTRNFSKNQNTYAISPDGSGSGRVTRGSTTPLNWKKSKVTFAASRSQVASYAAPRDVKWTRHDDPDTGKSIITFDKKDEKSIRNHRPVLSTWSDRQAAKAKFVRPGAAGKRYEPGHEGEFTSSKPGRPTSQRVIHDPVQHMKDAGHEVRFSDNIDQHRQELKKKNIDHDAEGFKD